MEIRADSWQCNECLISFTYAGDPVLAQCPSCGSPQLTRFIEVKDEMSLVAAEHIGLVGKDPQLPSKRKRRLEVRSGTRPEANGSGRLVNEYRMTDADGNLYEERVVDAETGEVLRDLKEPLSAHQGHGSAKKK